MAGTAELPLHDLGAIDPDRSDTTYDFDFVVIGGGSGGLAAAARAKAHGASVLVCDFVKPSPAGTKWGLGGTCVNVGCIPKKLFHTSALVGEMMKHSAASFGWSGMEDVKCDWNTLSKNVTTYIKSLNFGARSDLMKNDISYVNGYGKFVDPHTIKMTKANGSEVTHTARRVLISPGGRPTPLSIPGGEHAISSDDIFRLPQDPGKTLVVGASYVALECAGFLTGMGREITVMIRSIPLRGFDQQMAEKIVTYMQDQGTSFLRGAVPVKIELTESGKKKVTYKVTSSGEEHTEEYDTVMAAIGRTPGLEGLDLEAAGGVKLSKSGKAIIDKYDRTTVPHIYAIGDVVEGGLELTPVAIKSGRLLAARLYNKGQTIMDFNTVPTAVFTPLEYGAVGLSEEDAITKYTEIGIEVYHSHFTPLEWQLPHHAPDTCYMKIIVNKFDSERIVGFHVLAPVAGEMTQSMAVAIRLGATKATLDDTIGIHPIVAEELVYLRVTKSSGEDSTKGGC